MSRWCCILTLGFLMGSSVWADTSQLWGQGGERWRPDGRLPDFSHAGYREGRESIPTLPVTASVKDFGAKGDGTSDDSQAFLHAVQATPTGALFIPAGRYLLRQRIQIKRSGLVLRGEGASRTTLYFAASLTSAIGDGAAFAPGGSWSWSGGLLSFEGQLQGEKITEVIQAAPRGARLLIVADSTKLKAGQEVRLVMTDTDGSLARRLHNDALNGPADLLGKELIDFTSKIRSVDGALVTLERPVRTDIKPQWKPTLWSSRPIVQEVGVEDLTIEFPPTSYAGHHNEPGYNAIDFSGIQNGWARRLEILNADSGILLRDRTRFCTVESVRFNAASGRLVSGIGGHHGLLAMGYVQDCLLSGIEFTFTFIHDTAVSSLAAGNVFADLTGVDVNFDHHRKIPFENLFTAIDAGIGSRLWESGGDENAGPHSGARETFWNIRTQRPQELPAWGVETNVVGVTMSGQTSSLPITNAPLGSWVEKIPPSSLQPPNLYLAQLAAGNFLSNAAGVEASGGLAIRSYPNPWRNDRHPRREILFTSSSASGRIKIFTVSGHLVTTIPVTNGQAAWNLTTEGGRLAASGLYIYLADDDQGHKTKGKIAIIR